MSCARQVARMFQRRNADGMLGGEPEVSLFVRLSVEVSTGLNVYRIRLEYLG
jgi:hypothetical protein